MIDKIETAFEDVTPIPRKKIDTDNLRSITTNAGLIIVCIIAAMVSFWDLRITFDDAFSVGWVAIMLYFVATSVYRTKYDGGIYRGKQSEAYKKANDKFCELREKVLQKSLEGRLRGWCNAYRTNDLDNIRREIVCPYLSYDKYLSEYANLSKRRIKSMGLSKKVSRAIIAANDIEPAELSADMLLSASVQKNLFCKRRILPRSGDEQRRGDFIKNYAVRFFMTFICGMFIVEVVSDPTLDTFLQWMVRMIPIVLAFLSGESNGFANATEVTCKRIDAQARLLETFLADVEKVSNHEEAEALSSNGTGDRTHNNTGEFHGTAI
jgi:hypothetical protein